MGNTELERLAEILASWLASETPLARQYEVPIVVQVGACNSAYRCRLENRRPGFQGLH
jgi:hypothetical protein